MLAESRNLFCSFTFAGDMFVPVEDVQPLDSVLLQEAQVFFKMGRISAFFMCQ